MLDNSLSYEVGILVPEFTAVRANDVACITQPVAFGPLRPGDRARRGLNIVASPAPTSRGSM